MSDFVYNYIQQNGIGIPLMIVAFVIYFGLAIGVLKDKKFNLRLGTLVWLLVEAALVYIYFIR